MSPNVFAAGDLVELHMYVGEKITQCCGMVLSMCYDNGDLFTPSVYRVLIGDQGQMRLPQELRLIARGDSP